MRNLFIPEIGFEFDLAEEWTFKMIGDYRQDKFLASYGYTYGSRNVNGNSEDYFRKLDGVEEYDKLDITLPVGTNLKVDRIYIRKGVSGYSSLTFYMLLPGSKKKQRFFAKLSDVNRIMMK